MPKQLNNGKITEGLQRAFGFKGRYQPMLDEVIVPVYSIDDPAPAAPQRIVFGVRTAESVTEAAGRVFDVGAANPRGSGNLLILNQLRIQIRGDKPGGPSTAGIIPLALKLTETGILGADLTPNSTFRDRRIDGEPTTFLEARVVGGPAGSATIAELFVAFDTGLSATVGIEAVDLASPLAVLRPGSSLFVELDRLGSGLDATAPAALTVTALWIEVPITFVGPLSGTSP